MSLYLGPFYFDEKDIFLWLAVIIIAVGWLAGLPLPWLDYQKLMVLVLLFLVAKGLLVKTYDSFIFLVFLLAWLVSFFYSLTVVILFVIFSFAFLRVLKII